MPYTCNVPLSLNFGHFVSTSVPAERNCKNSNQANNAINFSSYSATYWQILKLILKSHGKKIINFLVKMREMVIYFVNRFQII